MDRQRSHAFKRVHKEASHKIGVAPQVPFDSSAPALELRDISFSYGKEPFIEALDMSISQGTITSIVGPNGCGKSTVLKIADGIITPPCGEVYIEGRTSLGMGNLERARCLALLSQGARPPAMTVEKLVSCGRYPYQGHMQQMTAEDKDQVEHALCLVGIESFRHHDVRFLSGGERQRAFIAMTLAQNTNIIMLDEPTTYLDIKACHEIMELVCGLHTQMGKTIIMVIHDLDLALRYSGNMIVMKQGACSCAGSVTEVLEAGALEDAFQMEICSQAFNERTAYTLFPLK